MKKTKISAFILIPLVIFITLFGALSMGMGMEHENGCWVSVLNDIACPKSVNSLSGIDLHFKALKGFSLAVFGNLLLLAIILFVTFRKLFLKSADPERFTYSAAREEETASRLSRRKFIRWLSLLYNSPSLGF